MGKNEVGRIAKIKLLCGCCSSTGWEDSGWFCHWLILWPWASPFFFSLSLSLPRDWENCLSSTRQLDLMIFKNPYGSLNCGMNSNETSKDLYKQERSQLSGLEERLPSLRAGSCLGWYPWGLNGPWMSVSPRRAGTSCELTPVQQHLHFSECHPQGEVFALKSLGEALVNESISSLERLEWFSQPKRVIIFSLKSHLL